MPNELLQFLCESEEVYRIVVEGTSDAILSIDEQKTIIFANRATENIFGYSIDELIGQSVDILMPTEFAAGLRRDFSGYLESGERRLPCENMKVLALRKDGSDLTCEISFAECVKNGERIFIAVARDVSERLRAEQSLAESQAMLALAVRSSNIGVWEQDLATDTVIWSPELEEIFGLPNGEFRRTRVAFYQLVHEDDRERIYMEVRTAIEEKREFEIEFRFYHSDGSVRWMEGRGQAFYADTGEPVRLYGTGVDITERKRAEEISRASSRDLMEMADAMPQVVWIADAKGVVNYYNRRVSGFYGGLGKIGSGVWNWQPIVHEDDLGATIAAWDDAVRAQTPYTVEHRIKMNDETFRWHLSRAFPVKNETGEIEKWYGTATDIDDLKRAGDALLKSEERLNQAAEISQTGVFEIDLTTGATEVDSIGRSIYGWSEAQPLTLDFVAQNHFHPEDRDEVVRILSATFAPEGKDEFDIEHRVLKTDGSTRWIRVRGRAFFNGVNGTRRAMRCIGTYIDTTERKRSEEALQLSEANFRQLAEAVPQFIWVTETDGSMSYVNQKWLDYSGLTLEQTNTPAIMSEIYHPEDRKLLARAWKKAFAKGVNFEFEGRIRKSTGEYRWFLMRSQPVKDENGNVLKWFGTSTDVTSNKRHEEQLRFQLDLIQTITDNTQACLLMMDAEGRGTFANHATERVTGFKPAELIGEILHEKIHHTHQDGTPFPREDCPLFKALPIKEAITGYEDVFVHKDGHFYPVRCAGRPLFKDGKPIGTIIEVQDITEEKRIEAERVEILEREKSARIEAENANRAKDEFLSVLSHELRTPLNAILGWTRMLKSGSLDEARNRQAIEIIERNARLQNNLIEDLLDVSRIISGKIRIEKEKLDLASVAVSALDTVRPLADAKSITIETDDGGEMLEICGDATRLEQIVVNLANNAVKFTPSGGSVAVRLSKNGGKARLEIADTGIGIGAELLPHIFDRFRQADSTTQRSHSGLGLGLTIVRHLVELHEGEIFARSDGEGKGAAFVVEIPLLDDSAQKTISPKSAFFEKQEAVYDNVLRGKSILLVDDDCDGMQPLKLFLEMHGAEAICSDSAAQALEEFKKREFDLILSDIGMPETDGYEFIGQIRQLSANAAVPAIALTAYASADDRERAFAAGFQTHHAKPLDFEKLLLTITEIFNQNEKPK